MAIPAAVFVYILSQNDLFWDKLCLMGRLISCSTLFWIYLPTLGGKILSQTESPAAVFNSTNISATSYKRFVGQFWNVLWACKTDNLFHFCTKEIRPGTLFGVKYWAEKKYFKKTLLLWFAESLILNIHSLVALIEIKSSKNFLIFQFWHLPIQIWSAKESNCLEATENFVGVWAAVGPGTVDYYGGLINIYAQKF